MVLILVMKTEMATGATIKAVEGFDKDGLKKAETNEKNPLPDKEGIYNNTLNEKIISAIYFK